ncbi:hypothetical protein AAG570_012288 [Ranatra chinensis]|uniref:Uncharacterized protein n=1 Tax=Ranatra chinensis TaxID=642074 RepID=A0ABD0YID0_9HEMI
MDPILSTSIWSKLSKISKTEGKTILLTTHYIEETKNSDKIGLMREGIMLTENVPSMLMAEQNCETIEQAFLSLINRQNLSSQNKNFVQNDQPLNAETDQTTYKMRMNRCLSGQRIWAMLIKNLYWMKRNYSMILFLIMLPGVQCVLMNLTVGREPEGLRVAIVNDELPSWEIVRYDEFDEAVKAARKNHVWGVLHFSQNYTASLINRIELAIMAPSYTVQHSQLEIWLDMSSK